MFISSMLVLQSGISPTTKQGDKLHAALRFSAPDVNGNLFVMDSVLKDHDFVVINLWATWCKPCVMEIPLLNSLKESFGSQVVFCAISYDEEKTTVTDFLKDHQFSYTMIQKEDLPDAEERWQTFSSSDGDNQKLLPVTVLYNRKSDQFKIIKGSLDTDISEAMSKFFGIQPLKQ